MGYRDVYDQWKADPEAFWMEAAEGIEKTVNALISLID